MLTALIALSILSTFEPAPAELALSDDQDGVITTSPSGVQSVAADAVAPVVAANPSVSLQSISPHGLTTAQQIDRWVGERSGVERSLWSDTRDPFAFRDDRKIHGEVTAGVGTNDYSAFGARVSIPVGETGRINLSYSQSRNSPWLYGYDGYAGRYGRVYSNGYDWDSFRISPFRVGRETEVPISAVD